MSAKYEVAVVTCADCGVELNRSCAIRGSINKALVTAGHVLLNVKCPNRCRSRATDCNASTHFKWLPATEAEIEYAKKVGVHS